MEQEKKIRIIVIGAGAISQQCHLPIFLGRKDIAVVAVLDKSPQTRSVIRKAYPKLPVYSELSDISLSQYDAAVVATPAAFHYSISKELLSNSKHVLVEKPVAFTASEANELVEIAKARSLTLSVSLYRRLYPSLKVMKGLMDSEHWGAVEGFSFLWGDVYSWSASSLGNMKKELAGGGVLMDLGPHALDWLSYLLPEGLRLVSYKDDAVTGIETDCTLKLAGVHNGVPIEGSLKLSRSRKLGGDLTVYCTDADLSLSVGERFSVTILPKKDSAKAVEYTCKQANAPTDEDWYETFSREHDDFIDAVKQNRQPILSGKSILSAAQIIDQCYASSDKYDFDWLKADTISLPDLSAFKSIFITGASGFVGGRLVEVLAENTHLKIYAGINNPNNATRISRYDIDLVQIDLNDPESLKEVVSVCDVVVHCAVGTAYGDDEFVYKTTVKGTENLLSLASEYGVKKFIHLSSLAVVDMSESDSLNEVNAKPTKDQGVYSRSKRDAEALVLKYASEQNIEVVILRPTTIYGPYAPLFKVGAGKQVVANGIAFSKSTSKMPSNSVYIDNVVSAIASSIAGKAEQKIYFLNDNDGYTYQDFYSFFTAAYSKPLDIFESIESVADKKRSSWFVDLLGEMKAIAKSKELRKLAIKIFKSNKLGYPLRGLVAKLPSLEDRLRDSSGPVYLRQKDSLELQTIDASTSATVSSSAFVQAFPTYSTVDRESALRKTREWIDYSNGISKNTN